MLHKSLFAMLAMALMTGAALAGSNRTGDVEVLDDVKTAADVGLSDLAAMLSADKENAAEIDADVLPVVGSEEKPADAEELGWRFRRHYGYGYYGHRHYRYRYYGYGCYYPYRYYYGCYYPRFTYHYGCWW